MTYDTEKTKVKTGFIIQSWCLWTTNPLQDYVSHQVKLSNYHSSSEYETTRVLKQ